MRFTVGKKIWLSISILILGYAVSMVVVFIFGQHTERRLFSTSESLFPASQESTYAATSFEQQAKLFNDAFLAGESSLIDDARAKAVNATTALSNIILLKDIPEKDRDAARKIKSHIEVFTPKAIAVYSKLMGGEVADDATMEVLEKLTAETEKIKEDLNGLSSTFSKNLKDELASVSSISRSQRYLNALLAFVVIICSIGLVKIILTKFIIKPLKTSIEVFRNIARDQGNRTKRIEITSNDELGEMAESFNIMSDTLEARENVLQLERDYSNSIINETPSIIFGVTLDGKCTFINPSAEKTTGYSKKSLLGKDWWRTLYPGAEYQQVDQLNLNFKKGNVHDYRMILTTKEGGQRTILWNSINHLDENGKTLEIISFGDDITEREKAEEQMKQVAMVGKEMEIARNIQTALIPDMAAQSLNSYEIAANMTPAAEVGGDYYDVLSDPQGRLWLGIGDVTGHGLVAGLIMMMAQVSINTIIRNIPGISPIEVLIYANRVIHQNIRHGLKVNHHMTINLLVEDTSGHFLYAGAHEIILIYRADTGEVEQIPTKGMWFGIIPDISKQTKNGAGEFEMNTGDVCLLYTDGVIEIMNKQREQFDINRLEDFLRMYAKNKKVEELKKLLLEELILFKHEQLDDITYMFIKK